MKTVKRLCGAVLFFLALSGVACADGLDTARAALHDRLYPVARQRAEAVLRGEKPGSPLAREALLLTLEALAGERNYDGILARIDTAIAKGQVIGENSAIVYWRTQALFHIGVYGKAAESAAAGTNATSPYAETLLRLLARSKRLSGATHEALQLFSQIDASCTNDVFRADNALEWARTLVLSGHSAEALDVLRRQSELGANAPSMSEGKLLRGQLLMRAGKFPEAVNIFNQLAMDSRAGEASRVQALVEMSVYAWDCGKTNEAVAFARTAVARATGTETRRVAGFRLGDLLTASPATMEEGAKRLRELIREAPETAPAMSAQLRLADAFLRQGKSAEAAAEYKIFLETYPSSSLDARVLEGRGWALLTLGQAAEASLSFARAADRSTQMVERATCWMKQADALVADKQFTQASAVYAKLANTCPTSTLASQAFFQSADALERAQQPKAAADRYAETAKRFPAHPLAARALLRLAALQAESGAYADAVKTYTAVLALRGPQIPRTEAWMGRGKVHYRTYRFTEAMQDFAAASEPADGQSDEARFLMILSLYGMGRDQEAKAAATAFLLGFPQSKRLPDTVLWLGKFSFNHAEYIQAQKYFLEYISRWPDARWAESSSVWAARSAFYANDFTGCVELVSKLRALRPKSARIPEALLLQANALIELARFDESILLLDRVISLTPESDWGRQALLRKGDCLFTMGAGNEARYEEALAAYQQRLRQGGLPESSVLQLHFKMARCLEKLKRTDEAVDQYYAEVMMRYQRAREQGNWLDENSTALFVRAGFSVAELYEQKGEPEQAMRVLHRVEQAGVPGSEEAKQRKERIKTKKAGI